MSLLNNPWVVGIGGGILSGLIVTAVSRFLLAKRENREYLQKVFSANRELIYSIRPGISEGVIPNPSVVDSLIAATARKFGVERKDLYGPSELVQELLKEVMDSSFISAKVKEDYCTKLVTLASSPAAIGREAEPAAVRATIARLRAETIAEYRERTTTMMSVMLGTLAALMTGLFAVLTEFKTDTPAKPLSPFFEELVKRAPVFLPTLVSLLAVMASMWIFMNYRDFVRRRNRRSLQSEGVRGDAEAAEVAGSKQSNDVEQGE